MNILAIESDEQLRAYLQELDGSRCTAIALDFEAEFNLHQYGEKLCLVQIFDGSNLATIDPFKVPAASLKLLFENRGMLKLMFDASSDLSLLENSLDMRVVSILDLSVAAAVLKYERRDLHSVLSRALGVSLEKKAKFQKYNWTRRPLDKEALEYALSDVRYLFDLKDELLKQVYEKKKMDEFILRNLNVQNKSHRTDPAERYRKQKGFDYLSPAEQDRLKTLFELRDKYARLLNWPANNVIANPDLFDLARGRLEPGKLALSARMSGDAREALRAELSAISR